MIYYKFSTLSEKYQLSYVSFLRFESEFKDSWFQDTRILSMVQDVEQATYIGNGWMHSTSGADYRISEISDGLQTLLLAYFGCEYEIRFDVLGANLYRYLSELFRDRDVCLLGDINPYICSLVGKTSLPPIKLIDFSHEVTNSDEFESFRQLWLSQRQDLGIKRFTNWNTPLANPVKLSYDYDVRYKNIPQFSITLEHKVTFIQGESASGKSYFLRILRDMQDLGLSISGDWALQDASSLTALKLLHTQNAKIIALVDMDKLTFGIHSFMNILCMNQNVLYILTGHWFNSTLYVPLESLLNIHYSRCEKFMNFAKSWLPRNSSFDHYDTILLEDSTSGKNIFETVFPESLCETSEGFSGLCSKLDCLNPEKTTLVVMDYSTASKALLHAVELQSFVKLDIIVLSSMEYLIMMSLGLESQYKDVITQLLLLDSQQLFRLLSYVRKTVLTVETLDLIAFSIILRRVLGMPTTSKLKSKELIEQLNLPSETIRDLVRDEIMRYNKPKESVTDLFM